MQRNPIAAALATLSLGLAAGPAAAEFPAGTSPVLLPMPALPRGPFPGSFDDLKPSAQQLAAASAVSRILLDLAKDPKNQLPEKRGQLQQMLRGWFLEKPILVAAITADMRTQVQQLYAAYFGRPADASGLASWVQLLDAGQSMASVAQQMFQTPAAQAAFPQFGTSEEIVAKIYTNLFGRQADTQGLAFWTAKLNAPGATPGALTAELINSVASTVGADPDTLKSAEQFNKATIASTFTTGTTSTAGSAHDAAAAFLSSATVNPGSSTQPPPASTSIQANALGPDPKILTALAQGITQGAVTNSANNSVFNGLGGGAGSTIIIPPPPGQLVPLEEAGAGFLGLPPGIANNGTGLNLTIPAAPPVTSSTVSLIVQSQAVLTVNDQLVTTQGTTNVQDLVTQVNTLGGTGGSGGTTPPIDINLQPTPLADIAALNAGNMGFTYNGTSATLGQALSFFVSYGVSPFFSGSIQGGTLPAGALGNNITVNGNLSGNALTATFIGGPNVVGAGSTFSGTLTGPSASGITTSYSINVNKSGGGTLPVADTGRMTR
ncbi:MAG: DUF4214 domain-containing protein [Burkholderiales bacterium]